MGDNGRDETLRDAVCEACEELIASPAGASINHIADAYGLDVDERFRPGGGRDPQAEFASALDFLEARVRGRASLCLLCWCHPKRCHADGIATELRRRIGPAGVEVLTHRRRRHARAATA